MPYNIGVAKCLARGVQLDYGVTSNCTLLPNLCKNKDAREMRECSKQWPLIF